MASTMEWLSNLLIFDTGTALRAQSGGVVATWYELLVEPFLNNWQPIMVSYVVFLVLQLTLPVVIRVLFPKYHERLGALDRRNTAVAVNAIIHALVLWTSIPYLFNPDPNVREDPIYGYSEKMHNLITFTVGYFFYDLTVSIWLDWGVGFVGHALASLFVSYFGLHPFTLYYGTFYFGCFELSTVFLHTRWLLEKGGYRGTTLFAVVEYGFAAVFAVVRVLLGTYVSYIWWQEMLHLMAIGNAHSHFVVWGYLLSNGVLMVLQWYWFVLIVIAAFSGSEGHTYIDEGEKKAGVEPKKKK